MYSSEIINSKYSSECKHNHRPVRLLWLFTLIREQQILKYSNFLQDTNICSTVIKCRIEYMSPSHVWRQRLFGRAVHTSTLRCFHEWDASQNSCIQLMNKTYIYLPQLWCFCGPSYLPFSSYFLLNVKLCEKCNTSYRVHDNFKLNADTLSPCCPRATNLIRDCCRGISREIKYPFREISLKNIKRASRKKKITFTSLFLSTDYKRSVGWLAELDVSNCRYLMLAEMFSPL